MANNPGFQEVLSKCLDLHDEWQDETKPEGFKLGSYSEQESKITLYNVLNTKENIARLRRELDSVGVRYRIIIHEPEEERSNLHVSDIGI